MMIANAVESDVLTIEQESFIYIKLDCTNSKDSLLGVDDPAVLLDRGDGGVQVWLLQTPKLRLVDLHRQRACLARSGSDRQHCRCRGRDRFSRLLALQEFVDLRFHRNLC